MFRFHAVQETSHVPNPDMFVMILCNMLMGARVLDVSANASDVLHVYAHCHPGLNGSFSLAFINIDDATAYT